MSGWIMLILLVALAVAVMWWLGLRGSLLQLGGAALLLGCAGYALHGSPQVAGSPRAVHSDEPPVPLTKMRHAFFGQFTGSESWMRISEALASRGNSESAVTVLRSAVRENPGNPALWIGLGNALVDHSKGMSPASEFAYRRAAELAPGHPAPAFFMGLALARSGDREGAILLWQNVLANAPADATWRPLVEDSLAALRGPAPVSR
ncbi:MAG: tetratricopeptide repeat protein [Pseudomonadota bacterium]|nr:tetratricopeptide repeat protein [Pseudomonadota bacterium]